ncbi:TVP38/TMEM64 family protein [Priestia taiwanensis]|uniref:TVP38/TMEM64 family membrane protein n=1 Tax=Priestia taiwanensis TaxID=1347902 RepID=A0A917AQ07_9BACI|nr:VTT domain-containing protein [Priestia taiwanensis]MBM7363037.1 putative membrane protein YdjX (TVP38/TMEM64 family) [Priestia taiwanensis]GGE67088.1 TVP38/TMEM64 family protein [Priestia taiwanensis]
MNQQELLAILEQYSQYALFISILLNIAVALVGVLPSVFITAANLVFFGPVVGFIISIIGEVVGAIIAFGLYRKGLQKASRKQLEKYPKILKLLDAKGKDAFNLIVVLRTLPFMPSGLVTLAASIGQVSMPIYASATLIGKIPGLLIEAVSVYQVVQFNWIGKAILIVIGIYWLYLVLHFLYKKRRKKCDETKGNSTT